MTVAMARRTRPPARVARRLLPVVLLPLSAAACTVTLVSTYDEHIDESATVLQHQMDAFLTRMEAQPGEPEASYAANADFYRNYLVDLRAVEVRASAHEKNDITLQQIALLRGSIEELRAVHEEQGRISTASAATFRELFNTAWRAVIQWELAKKRGEG